MLLATGLDPDRSTVFAQSHVTAHAEASWLLSAVTSYGQLGRMTQFKDKSDAREFVSAGPLHLPGADGRRHPPLPDRSSCRSATTSGSTWSSRVTSRSASTRRFGETFVVPAGIYPEVGARIMDLQEPTKKMSTTGRHRAGHGQAARRARRRSAKKFRSRGDGFGPRDPARGRQAGRLEPDRHPRRRHRAHTGGDRDRLRRLGLRRLQEDVGDAVADVLAPVRERYLELRADEGELLRLLGVGAEKARDGVGADAHERCTSGWASCGSADPSQRVIAVCTPGEAGYPRGARRNDDRSPRRPVSRRPS